VRFLMFYLLSYQTTKVPILFSPNFSDKLFSVCAIENDTFYWSKTELRNVQQ
jgi:hypothetical protein